MFGSRDTILIGVLLGLACAIGTAIGLVALRPLLARYALARPNARSSHKVPTPQGGGMAIISIATLGIVAAIAIDGRCGPWWPTVPVLVAALVLAIVGAADDIIVLRASPRLLFQLVAAAVVILTMPTRILPLPPSVEIVLLVLALVWFINLVNFMDGIDWITVVEVLPICGGIGTLAVLGAAPPNSFVVAVAIGGAMLGFAPFNKPIAKLFLGDVGSLPLGLLLGWQLVVVASSGHLAAAVLLPLYYLADATITLGRRLANGERVWEAHRTHFYQRATDRGWTVIQVDRAVLVTNVVLMALAIASIYVGVAGQLALVGSGCMAVGVLLVCLVRGQK